MINDLSILSEYSIASFVNRDVVMKILLFALKPTKLPTNAWISGLETGFDQRFPCK